MAIEWIFLALIATALFVILYLQLRAGRLPKGETTEWKHAIQSLEERVLHESSLMRDELSRMGETQRSGILEAVGRFGETIRSGLEARLSRNGEQLRETRGDLALSAQETRQTLVRELESSRHMQAEGLSNLGERVAELSKANQQFLVDLSNQLQQAVHNWAESSTAQNKQSSQATLEGVQGVQRLLAERLEGFASRQNERFEAFQARVDTMSEKTERRLRELAEKLDEQVRGLREDNSRQLEKMRETVDEKLQGTLEKRLGESFKQVSERLEQVHTGLGEMKTLASGVGDLKRVLTNVSTRGTWGEVQLGNLLEQVLVPSQYSENVSPLANENRVEYAIKLPGKGEDSEQIVWLPIDAKFPNEDYQRLLDAQDQETAESAWKMLETRIRNSAKDIQHKYVSPPATTDFAILFLPTEGLFAEVMRRPGLAEDIQQKHRIVIAGPTTLWAILNSLQMGFRTLAIQKRSSEVWQVLSAVKTEWKNYEAILTKVQKKLQEASNTVDQASRRTRAVGRRLGTVDELPSQEDAATILELRELGAEPLGLESEDH